MKKTIRNIIFLLIFLAFASNALATDTPEEAESGEMLIEKIGCLNCHAIDGKGGSVAPDLSHVHERFHEEWLYRFLKKPYTIRPLGYIPYSGIRMPNLHLSDNEAKKIAHHLSTLKEVEIARRVELDRRLHDPKGLEADLFEGRKLLRRLPCLSCHSLTKGRKGTIAPDLFDIGTRLQPAFIYLWLENPQAFDPKTIMPNFGLKDNQLFPITRYLMSLKRDLAPVPGEAISGKIFSTSLRVAEAEQLFRDLCIRCHALEGQGGTTGPDLSHEGDKVHRRWLYNFIKKPYRIRPLGFAQNALARMPQLNLSDDELMMMTEFVTTLRKGRNLNHPSGQGAMAHDMMAEPGSMSMRRKEMVMMGKMVINMKGCSGCHRIGKLSLQRVTIGPDLTYVGDRLKEPWIYSWMKDPQKYRPDTLMPNMGLSDMQAHAVAAYLSERKAPKNDGGGR